MKKSSLLCFLLISFGVIILSVSCSNNTDCKKTAVAPETFVEAVAVADAFAKVLKQGKIVPGLVVHSSVSATFKVESAEFYVQLVDESRVVIDFPQKSHKLDIARMCLCRPTNSQLRYRSRKDGTFDVEAYGYVDNVKFKNEEVDKEFMRQAVIFRNALTDALYRSFE
jgi:hypothetical protein